MVLAGRRLCFLHRDMDACILHDNYTITKMKILAVVPMPFDGTSFYRAYGIFPDLKKQFGGDFEVNKFHGVGVTYTWADLLPYDILFLQRPALDAAKHIKMVEYMKAIGKKVWVDWDDNLFAVPMENRVYDDMTPQVRKATMDITLMADLVTVSTGALQEFFIELGCKKVEVVPNAWDFERFPMASSYNELKDVPPPQEKKLHYLWRGSETHQGDLLTHSEIIYGSIQRGEHWTFMGYNPWFLTESVPHGTYTYLKSEDIQIYLRILKQQKAQALVFPLRDHLFNRCKSNIAWIEATYAGMVCIAPDWPEWQLPGVITYTGTDQLQTHLSQDYSEYAGACWRSSKKYITENLSLSLINSKRKQLLTDLIK